MPDEALRFGDRSEESEELFQISPHCTWCALHAIRQQERTNRGEQVPCSQEDSSSSTGGERELMCSRRKVKKPAFNDSDRDSSDDESLSQNERTEQCRRYVPDVRQKGSHVRNSCVRWRSKDRAKTTGMNARCASCHSPVAELPKTCEDDKRDCDHELKTAAGTGKDFRQIVMESRCPCLCAYLHFTDTVDACTCVRRSPSCATPDRDTKILANATDDHKGSHSAPNDKNSFCCCIARYFSSFRKHSKRSNRNVNTHQPPPQSLEQKNSVPAGDREVANDTCRHKELDQCGRCQVSGRNSEMVNNNIPRKASKRESFQSASVQRETNADAAPRASTEIMGRDLCINCQRASRGLEDAEKVHTRVRCTCDCESRNKDLKKFRSSLQRICRALSGCKRSSCNCECHGKRGEEKDNGNDTRVLNQEENRRSKRLSGGSGEKTSLPKRGMLALKYEILRCKEFGGNSKETEGSSSACERNQLDCHCLKQPPTAEHGCSRKDARASEPKLDKCCLAEEKKCSRKACLGEQKCPRVLATYKSKNDSPERQGKTVQKANIASEDEEMIINPRYPKEKLKQKRGSNKKSKLTNAQRLHERDPSGVSADDSSDESEVEVRKNGRRKAHEMKANSKSPREVRNDNTNFLSEPTLDPISAEVIKIGNRYYQAIRHRTAHVNIMSFKNLKSRRQTRHRGKDKKSPRIEVRLRYDTTSSEDDSPEAAVHCTDHPGDSPCHRSKLEQRKCRRHRTARDKPVKKAVGSDVKEAKLVSKKRHCGLLSAGAMDGQCGNVATAPVAGKCTDKKKADRKDSSGESVSCDNVEQLPKAMTDPPSEKVESPRGWKSEGSPLKGKGVSARTMELKQMSERWFADDAKQWGRDQVETTGDAINSGTCFVRPFTASSSAS